MRCSLIWSAFCVSACVALLPNPSRPTLWVTSGQRGGADKSRSGFNDECREEVVALDEAQTFALVSLSDTSAKQLLIDAGVNFTNPDTALYNSHGAPLGDIWVAEALAAPLYDATGASHSGCVWTATDKNGELATAGFFVLAGSATTGRAEETTDAWIESTITAVLLKLCRLYCVTLPRTLSPTLSPTPTPSLSPTLAPTPSPTPPTASPTAFPTLSPTTPIPTLSPTLTPTLTPTTTRAPTRPPTLVPTRTPTASPTLAPTLTPTVTPTLSPTPSPTFAPTFLPSAAPTLAPSLSPTTRSPSSAPTPTPTLSPTTLSPTPTPSLAPSTSPTLSPTTTPTGAPTRAPTRAPTSWGQRLEPDDGSAEVSWTEERIRVVVPPKDYLPRNSEVWITRSHSDGSGGVVMNDLILSIDLVVNGTKTNASDLDRDFVFELPYSQGFDKCHNVVTCSWWDTDKEMWSSTGCSGRLLREAGVVECSCNHLTDFALLSSGRQSSLLRGPHTVFAVVYSVLLAYGLVICLLLVIKAEHKRHVTLQHCLVVLVCLARVLSSLSYLQVFGPLHPAISGILAATPFLLEIWALSLVIYQWAVLVHFGMTAKKAFARMRPVLIALNTLSAACFLFLFISLSINPHAVTAIAGTTLLALLTLALATCFLVYSQLLTRQLSRTSARSGKGTSNVSLRIMGGGYLLLVALSLQAILSAVATYLQLTGECPNVVTPEVALLTTVYLMLDVIALLTLYMLYAASAYHFIASPTVGHSSWLMTSTRGSPTGSPRGSPRGSIRGSPRGSTRGSTRGSPRGSMRGSPMGSPSRSKTSKSTRSRESVSAGQASSSIDQKYAREVHIARRAAKRAAAQADDDPSSTTPASVEVLTARRPIIHRPAGLQMAGVGGNFGFLSPETTNGSTPTFGNNFGFLPNSSSVPSLHPFLRTPTRSDSFSTSSR